MPFEDTGIQSSYYTHSGKPILFVNIGRRNFPSVVHVEAALRTDGSTLDDDYYSGFEYRRLRDQRQALLELVAEMYAELDEKCDPDKLDDFKKRMDWLNYDPHNAFDIPINRKG